MRLFCTKEGDLKSPSFLLERRPGGFTLIELMVVIVIIGILAAIAIPNYMALKNRVREASLKENMHTLQICVEDFHIRSDHTYPGDLNTTILQVNPAYTGPEPNMAVALQPKPPYGANSILGDNVVNPFNPSQNALGDGPGGNVGGMSYQASNTPTDDPVTGAPWTEAGPGPALMYRISGHGVKGVLPLVLFQCPSK